MNAGLLFYQAHRTALCEQAVKKHAARMRIDVASVNASARADGLCRALAAFLRDYPLVYLIGAVGDGRLLSIPPVCQALHVPLNARGEPERVKPLPGFDADGYLLESRTQAILLLPDLPDELNIQLPGAERRLAEKFGLEPPKPKAKIDYEALVDRSFAEAQL